MRRDESNRAIGWMTLAAGAAVGLGAYYTLRSQRSQRPNSEMYEMYGTLDPYFTESITINQPIGRVYQAWRNLESVGFMQDVEITESRDPELCTWRTPRGAVGRAEFMQAPGARGTEVRVHIERGAAHSGGKLARMLGLAPDQQLREDLRRFKQLLETGELTLSDGPGLSRPAQPPMSIDEINALAGVER
jgi:uncharacterized membrane protein